MPAAATTTTSRASASATAARISGLSTGTAKDRLSTLPRSAPARIASAIIAAGACSSAPSKRTGAIRASGATPSTRSSPAGRPAISPAIGVPWFSQSSPVPGPTSYPAGLVYDARKSIGAPTAPASLGCRASTPESTTATVTPRPVDSSQARRSPSRSMSGSWP